jgi:DNA helicase HerA-like ATPase
VLQFDAQQTVIVVAGVSGSGKSTFALRYLVGAQHLVCRFIFDPRGEFAERLKLVPAETVEELECAIEDGFVIFDPHKMFPGNPTAALEWFAGWVFQRCHELPGCKLLLVDEVWKYTSPHTIPLSLAMCVQEGRKGGLGTMFCTQRPNRINEAILNEITEFVCFLLKGNHALETAEDHGHDPDEIRELPKGAFVSVTEDGRTARGRLW